MSSTRRGCRWYAVPQIGCRIIREHFIRLDGVWIADLSTIGPRSFPFRDTHDDRAPEPSTGASAVESADSGAFPGGGDFVGPFTRLLHRSILRYILTLQRRNTTF